MFMGSFMPAPTLAALTLGRGREKKEEKRFFFFSEARERLSGVFAAEVAGVVAAEGQRIMSWVMPLLRAARKWTRSPTNILKVWLWLFVLK